MQVQKFPLLVERWAGLTPYPEAVRRMEAAVADVLAGGPERVFVCEHAPVFTIGSSGKAEDVLDAGDIPVAETGRGGKVTYHGPGQVVVYPVIDLGRRGKDLRAYIRTLQAMVVAVLGEAGIEGRITDDVGVWVETERGLEKVAAIGVRVRKWVAYHGVAINVCNDLDIYKRIVPCGMRDKGVVNMRNLEVEGGLKRLNGGNEEVEHVMEAVEREVVRLLAA